MRRSPNDLRETRYRKEPESDRARRGKSLRPRSGRAPRDSRIKPEKSPGASATGGPEDTATRGLPIPTAPEAETFQRSRQLGLERLALSYSTRCQTRPYDPALRRRPDIVKGITGHKSQSGIGRLLEDADIIGRYDVDGLHNVIENAFPSCQRDVIPDA